MTARDVSPATLLASLRATREADEAHGRGAVTVVIPKPLWLTSNRHAVNRGHRAAIVRGIHDEMFKAAYRAGLKPLGAGPVHATWVIRYPKGVRRDKGEASNCQPTTKACLDALVPRWLDDDGPLIVTAETFTRGPNLDRPSDHEITLLLSEETT